jgi:protein-S-isoprenylcysteine O-methyltransferase Ste14
MPDPTQKSSPAPFLLLGAAVLIALIMSVAVWSFWGWMVGSTIAILAGVGLVIFLARQNR